MPKLVLYRPVNGNFNYPWGNMYHKDNTWQKSCVGQFFGEDNACVDLATHTKFITREKPTCPAGYESVYKWVGMKGHNGLDISCKFREPVYSPIDGIVTDVSHDRGKGIGCYVRTEKMYDYQTTLTYWKFGLWHFDEIVVENGQRVYIGNLLGYGDTTGYSTGCHLHWEGKPVYLQNGVWYNKEQENGYYGAVDILPYVIEVDADYYKTTVWSVFNQLKIIAEKIKWLFSQIK